MHTQNQTKKNGAGTAAIRKPRRPVRRGLSILDEPTRQLLHNYLNSLCTDLRHFDFRPDVEFRKTQRICVGVCVCVRVWVFVIGGWLNRKEYGSKFY